MSEVLAELEIKNLTKHFAGAAGAKLQVLNEINFKSDFKKENGSLISILAPFGAGKSTLLKIIAAIEKPNEGSILLNGSLYDKPDGKIIYLPEKPSSYPWLSVKQNIEFALKLSGNTKYKTEELISLVGLTGYDDHFPHEKSTGFRFRISLARALAVNPVLILLDDPFKQLHALTKKEIHSLIQEIKEKTGINFLLTTTNITESISLSDKILLMKNHPGEIFKEIEIEQSKIKSGENDYFNSLRIEIENAYSAFAGIPLVSEVRYK